MADGSEQALARYRDGIAAGESSFDAIHAAAEVGRAHTTQDLARVADLMLGLDTLEGRAVRAEQASAAALARAHTLECQLDSVRMALRLERVPRQADAGGPLTLMGRVRHLGDRARRAERERDALRRELKRLREEFSA
jgi:hypothetical protein